MCHGPGGTVRLGEPLVAFVKRVAATELGLEVSVGPFLGYIEYPSHYLNGLVPGRVGPLEPRRRRSAHHSGRPAIVVRRATGPNAR